MTRRTGERKEYPYRPCPCCGDPISKRNANGELIEPAKYKLRKTCNGEDCRSDSWHNAIALSQAGNF